MTQKHDKAMKSCGAEFTIFDLIERINHLFFRIFLLENRVKDLEPQTNSLDERTFPMATIGSTEI